jgi:prepilin-type processing-associated H-X9-DG protein
VTRRPPTAFTLVELLATVAITSLLIGLLLPALGSARGAALRTACLSNQRQMMLAATMYAHEHDGHFMPALYTDFESDPAARVGWDFVEMYTDSGVVREPGAMWARTDTGEVLQCPAMDGPANWQAGGDEDPYTGYNYNTSYIGGPTIGPDPAHPDGSGPRMDVDGDPIGASARMGEIADPGWTAVFGDGAFGGGANKFMRSPFQGDRDSDIGRAAHGAGAQSFLHAGASNAALADGHARSFRTAHRETYPEAEPFLADRAGFLSAGNGLYDLSLGRE